MSVDIAKTKQGIYDWAKANSGGKDVIWDRPNELLRASLSAPYVSLTFLTGPVSVGGEDVKEFNSADEYIISGSRNMTVSVIVFGHGTGKVDVLQLASDLQSSLHKPINIELLDAAEISIVDHGNVIDASQLLESGFEERAVLDIIFGVCTLEIDSSITPIEEVDVAGSIENPPGTKLKTSDPNQTTEENEDLGPGLIDSTP